MNLSIRIFTGATSMAMARVYAECTASGLPGAKISGFVRGPHSEFGHTLPATFALKDLGPGESLLSEGIVTEPCYWSPDAPAIYEAKAEVRNAEEVTQVHEQIFALRAVNAKGKSLYREGKRFVLRGVVARDESWFNFAVCRQVQSAIIAPTFRVENLQAAAKQGVCVAPLIQGRGEELVSQIRDVAAAAVSELLLIAATEGDEAAPLRQFAPGMLLVQLIDSEAHRSFSKPAAWAHAVAVNFGEVNEVRQVAAKCDLPVIAIRRDPHAANLAEARAASDVLQRELAASGDFAGYIA